MQFNSEKFQAIRFAELFGQPVYNNDVREEIDHTLLVKDLGIYLSSDMKFDQHVRTVINKGKKLSGWILRIFSTRSPSIMMTLLKQLIYPTIEYNSVLWSPTENSLIDPFEAVQKNFLRQIITPTLARNSDYWDRLQHFKLYSLQRRRERYAIMYAWKVIHNIYPNPGLHMNTTFADHLVHPNQGIQINMHQRLGFTAHHNTNLPRWLKDKSA